MSMRVQPRLAWVLAAATVLPLAAQPNLNWAEVSPRVTAREVATGGGQTWFIGTTPTVNGNYNVMQWTSNGAVVVPGQAVRIAVDTSGTPWVVTAQGGIWKRNTAVAGGWQQMPGGATDISAGLSALWVIGGTNPAVNNGFYKWNGTGWDAIAGLGVRISLDAGGLPYVATAAKELWKYDTSAGASPWRKLDATGVVHAAPHSNGTILIARETDSAWYDGTKTTAMPAKLSRVAFGNDGTVWGLATADGAVMKGRAGDFTISTTIISGGTTVAPITTGLLDRSATLLEPMEPAGVYPYTTMVRSYGTAECVGCGTTKADWVGEYKLNTTCSAGFYSTTYGGTCWTCPPESAEGLADTSGLKRWSSYGSLPDDAYCKRQITPVYVNATFIKGGVRSGIMAWDCDSGQGWNMLAADGSYTWWGGSCWSCPEGYSFLFTNSTCSKSQETAPVKMLKFNGCPEPNATSMGLPPGRTPGKPFLDVAGGWSEGVAAGGCYACPATDGGKIVVTERNLNTLINGKTSNNGCDVKFRYAPGPYPEPGLHGLAGVKEVIWEQGWLSNPALMTALLHKGAEANGLAADSAEARAWVKAAWQQIATAPYKSPALQGLMYGVLRNSVGKPLTPGVQQLTQSFQSYIQSRRTFVATQALDMYDKWLPLSNASQPKVYFSMSLGAVPLDFSSAARDGLLLASTGLATAASVASVSAWGGYVGEVVSQARTTFFTSGMGKSYGNLANLNSAVRSGSSDAVTVRNALLSAEKSATNSTRIAFTTKGGFFRLAVTGVGPFLVQVVASLVLQMYIEQWLEKENARPKLLTVLDAAKKPVDYAAMANDIYGDDQAVFYWSKAMEGGAGEDQQLIRIAQSARDQAAETNYAKP